MSSPIFITNDQKRYYENLVLSAYDDQVSIFEKEKVLVKFGRNDDLGTTLETVWLQGGNETFAIDNDIDSISSDSADDTQEVVVEGHTISGGELTFVVQTVTLTGQDTATLSTPLYRANRLYNNGSVDFSGTVYVYESGGTVTGGVPQTAADIHLKTDGNNNQSLKCATSLSSQDYWIITGLMGAVDRQQSRSVDFRLQIREYGKVFRTRYPFSAHSNSGSRFIQLEQPIIAPPNSDVRMLAIASGTTTVVDAAIHGYLAIKK